LKCSWVKGWFRSAKALQGLGNLELAVQAVTKAQQLQPGNKDVSEFLMFGGFRAACLHLPYFWRFSTNQ
jgi:predicted TPR repeat methyltransferase